MGLKLQVNLSPHPAIQNQADHILYLRLHENSWG